MTWKGKDEDRGEAWHEGCHSKDREMNTTRVD